MRTIKTGVYKILNTINNDYYIGSSRDITNRWNKHTSDLMKNKHPNRHLQNAWNKYGKEAFVLEILETCELIKEVILEREQYYIDTLKPKYNILPNAGSRLGAKASDELKEKLRLIQQKNKYRLGFVTSEETKKKQSEAHKGKKHTEKTKQAMCESRKDGKSSRLGTKHSDESKQKMTYNNNKLDADTVLKLREIHSNQKITLQNLADQFGIDVSTVHLIVKRKRWTHI